MPAIVEFPTVVQDLLVQYHDLFANAPERQHFAEYLTGLFIAERKTVSGINREFAVTTDQSCLNRWITESSGMHRRSTSAGLNGCNATQPLTILRTA